MRLVIESTKTNTGTRKLSVSEDVFRFFHAREHTAGNPTGECLTQTRLKER